MALRSVVPLQIELDVVVPLLGELEASVTVGSEQTCASCHLGELMAVVPLPTEVDVSVPLAGEMECVSMRLGELVAVTPRLPELSATYTGAPVGPERNVIFFFLDDIGQEYLAAYDATNDWATPMSYPATPNIDTLAASGLVLTGMHSSPVCSPSRAQWMTGKLPINNGITVAIDNLSGTKLSGPTLLTQMRDSGSPHLRWAVGKWHLGHTQLDPTSPFDDGGFNNYRGCLTNFGSTDALSSPSNYTNYTYTKVEASGDATQIVNYTVNALESEVENAQAGILSARRNADPFFLYVAFHSPHEPTQWESAGLDYLGTQGWHSYGAADPGADWLRFKALIEATDYGIGEILDYMTAEERANTMVVLVGDNGSEYWHCQRIHQNNGATGLPAGYDGDSTDPVTDPGVWWHFKQTAWRDGVNPPCIIQGPDVSDPGTWGGLCSFEDLYNAFAEWVRLPGYHAHETDATDAVLHGCASRTSPGRNQVAEMYCGLDTTPGDVGQAWNGRVGCYDSTGYSLVRNDTDLASLATGGSVSDGLDWLLYSSADERQVRDIYPPVPGGPNEAAYERMIAHLQEVGITS
jgi:arylsulfatase A-like enzyme